MTLYAVDGKRYIFSYAHLSGIWTVMDVTIDTPDYENYALKTQML